MSQSSHLPVQVETQVNPVADDVLALVAVVRPILKGLLYALKEEVVAEVGGRAQVKLMMLPRLYRQGDGDCGICFEYAVHEAMRSGDARVVSRVNDAMKLCRVPGTQPTSILFGLEKTGAQQIIEAVRSSLTGDSLLMYGTAGRPVKLKNHIGRIASAFRNPRTANGLPYSISGLWKADLFLGFNDTDKWVGTTVKINPAALVPAKGLRVGIVPTKSGRSDKPRKDETKNLVICPLSHDGDFMQTFYEGWVIVQQFIHADAQVPKEVALPRPDHRHVARLLEERRRFPIVDIIEALEPLAQPELMRTEAQELLVGGQSPQSTGSVLLPIARPLPEQT